VASVVLLRGPLIRLAEQEDMDPQSTDERLTRENAYLRQRNAQLQQDMIAVTAEAQRLQQMVDRLHGRTAHIPANPLGGGQ
jgi:hypothetical protein